MLILILFMLSEALPLLKIINPNKFKNVNSIILLVVEFLKFIWYIKLIPCIQYKKRKQEKKRKYIELILNEFMSDFMSSHSLKLNDDDKQKIENIGIKLDEIEKTLTL